MPCAFFCRVITCTDNPCICIHVGSSDPPHHSPSFCLAWCIRIEEHVLFRPVCSPVRSVVTLCGPRRDRPPSLYWHRQTCFRILHCKIKHTSMQTEQLCSLFVFCFVDFDCILFCFHTLNLSFVVFCLCLNWIVCSLCVVYVFDVF